MKKNNFKEWTKYDNSMILKAGLYYAIVDYKECEQDGTIYKGHVGLEVLEYVNTVDKSRFLQYTANCTDRKAVVLDYQNAECEYHENSFFDAQRR